MLGLGFAGAILDVGRHVVGLEQEGSVGHVSFLFGGLRGKGRGVSVCSASGVGKREYTKYPEFIILASATQACVDSLFLCQPPCLPIRANLEKRKVTASKNIFLWSHYLLPTHGVEPCAAWVCPRKLCLHSS